jgi:hypothetical protein
LFGALSYFNNHPDARSATAYAAVIVPALLIIGIFFAIGRYLIEEQDEYLRLLMVRQTLVARPWRSAPQPYGDFSRVLASRPTSTRIGSLSSGSGG